MHDFLRFLRHLCGIVYFARGVFLSLGLLLLICVLVICKAEAMPFGRSLYFVLVTALTIGYGDITPQTAFGGAASVAAGLIGIVITGIFIAAAVRALGQAMQEKQANHRHDDDSSP